MKGNKPKLIVIVGPTSSGKSALAMEIAQSLSAGIVNADSLQVYRYLDIGTAKPTLKDRERIKHHLVDILDPDEEFNAGSFKERASNLIDHLNKDNSNIIVAGGTYLYVKILLSGLIDVVPKDPEIRDEIKKENSLKGTEYLYSKLRTIDPRAAEKIHSNDYVRIERALEVYYLTGKKISELHERHSFNESPYDYMKIGIDVEREALRERIDHRVDNMMAQGFIDEVRSVREMGYDPGLKPMQSIGYKQINQYLDNEMELDQAVELIRRDTKRFAKRQMTWLRNDQEIKWFRPEQQLEEIIEVSKRHVKA